ncbi:hypothetical protein LXL04_020300 [Taraxacum kok-saghyz]
MESTKTAMEAFEKLEKVGEGTYGKVYRARDRATGSPYNTSRDLGFENALRTGVMEDSATITECLLLSELQSSSDLSSIYHLFSSYLHPFTAIINKPKKQSKPSEINAKASTIIHSLAKKFTSFLNKALNLIPKRLNETPKIESCYASELFEAYKLCLSCLESIMSALSCKPHYVQFQRLRLIHCYQVWGRYEDAQNEGFSLLEYIWKLWGERGGNLKREVIPQLTKENGDKDVAMLILDVVVTHCNCVLNGRSKDNEVYRRLLSMVDEVQPWWRFVEGYAYEKLHKLLVTYLTKCTLFLVGELAIFEGSLVQNFCVLTLSEITKLSANDQMEKFGRMICNSVFSQLNDHLLCSVEILTCVLDYMAHECKNGMDKSLVDFLKLVDYCAIKCRNATVDIGGAVATHFNKLAAELSQVTALPIDLIMRLYAITLSVTDLNGGNTKKKIAGSLLKMEDQLQDLTAKLGSLTCQCRITEMTNLPLLFKALRFLCGPLSKLVISERKDILCGLEDVSFSIKLPNIQDAFHQFGLVFLAYRAYERERDVYEDNMQTVLNVAAAAFTLSLATKENVKESTTFLLQLISADWVQANGLKFLFPNLHNVGIMLYKINRLKEAAKSVKLCRQAAWNRVLLFCKTFSSSSKDAFSSDTIAGFVTEACEESASLLDILHLSGSNKTSKILTDSLESWSIAHSLFHKIPFPMVLIEQWVKIVCEEMKDSIAGRTIPTIYSLMSSFNMSKETLGILLEEELQAYKELKYLNPTLCKTMQMSITDILLEEIYTRKDSYLQRSRILLAKERESRAYGVDGLNDCIKYLSEAISIMQSIYKSNDGSGPVCCLLAEAYCLRALCTQEAEPNSKHFIEDVGNALKLWLSQEHEQTRNTLTLLYYVADMLSLKGYMEHHSDIYETMIKSFMWKNIPLQECLIMLWQSRSLSHALCASTVSDEFIMTFSKHCKLSKSVEFWISCLERSKSLEVGFRQSLSVISTLSSPDSDRHNHITIHEAKQVAYDLISKVPLSSNSLFLAAHLYYDLGETLIAKGSMIEALYYAKEAHRLRAKLFLKNFRCLIELQNDIVGATAETVQKCRYDPKSFHMHRAMATAAWSYDKRPGDFEGSILTPWNVLKVYLESTLQVGTIQEIVGNGSEAKTLLLWGKNISSIQDLPIFVVGFSCALGKLYREQKLWHLAERELEAAKHILADSSSLISCLKCRLVMEVTVDQQLGDLFQSRFSSTSDDRLLFKAETFYRCATDKLNVSAWKNCVSAPEEANTMLCDALLISGQETIQQPKVTRKSKKITQRMTCRTITTRSRSRKQRDEYCIPTCGCEGTCEVECWHCLPCQLIKSMSLTSIIQMKWECIRRRLLLRLLIGKGKCLGVGGEIQRSHQVLLESLSVLVSRSTFRTSCFSVSIPLLVELIEKKVIAEVFALEHASILYNICWFSLGTRNDAIPVPIVVSGLKLSFILCREVPVLFQKVSRLLAVLYTISSYTAFPMLSSSISESQWASYFHQASLGTPLNHQFSCIGKQEDQKTTDVNDSFITSSGSRSWLRLAPESVLDLEEFISKFFRGLPCLTVICISMLGDDYSHLLRELFFNNPPTHACIMLSRLNSDSMPTVILLPINSILAGSSEDDSNLTSSNQKSCHKLWTCPWGHTIVDDVAPLFRMILEKHYMTSMAYPLEDTEKM